MKENRLDRSLNLDSMFIPIPYPEIEFNMFQFSGGEWHIKLNNNIDYSKVNKVVVSNRVNDANDVFKILLACDALRRKGVNDIELFLPYIPYARQDRVCQEGESFSLKIFTNIINSMMFNKVYVLDSHSDVAVALIDNCVPLDNHKYVEHAICGLDKPYLISPDAGANKKATKLYQYLNTEFSQIVKCDKTRNTITGELSGFEVFYEDFNGSDCIIVDDICDGGGTFIGLAKELKKKGAGDLYLFVTHGIFSKGVSVLLEEFAEVFTTNSIRETEGVIQLKIQ